MGHSPMQMVNIFSGNKSMLILGKPLPTTVSVLYLRIYPLRVRVTFTGGVVLNVGAGDDEMTPLYTPPPRW